MWLIKPSFQQYNESAQRIIEFSNNNWLDYCIYGSFLHEWKLRPWLSDIDWFLLSSSQWLFFPISLTIAFWEIKKRIEDLWIPLQLNFNTTWKLQSKTFAPDISYIEEVKRWVLKWLSSSDFRCRVENTNFRDGKSDDLDILRHYYKKASQIWLYFYEISEIIKKEENEITKEEQDKLVKLWDSFKKMISILTLAVRISKWESTFSKKDSEILETFKSHFGINHINVSKYLEILQKVRWIEDWFIFLKNWWLNQIIDIYENLFSPFLEVISYKLDK